MAKTKAQKWWISFKKNSALLTMTLPFVIFKFIFSYIPMVGIIIAFKNYRYDLGMFKSEWNGFDNFRFFFVSPDAWRVTRNTIGYNITFIILGLVSAVIVAFLLYRLKNKATIKTYQTIMFFPHFLSWVVVSYIVYGFLNRRLGLLNGWSEALGLETIDWYNTKSVWVFILPIVNVWKGVGTGCLFYYASLIAIDNQYIEAAYIEGANDFQIAIKILLPFLYPLMVILTTLAIGRIFTADFGLFYQVPMNSKTIYETTDVIDTYLVRALIELGNISMSAAIGVFKSFVGFVLILITNGIVRKINSENALF